MYNKHILFFLFFIPLFSCGQQIKKKVLSEEDWYAPFGLGSLPWRDYIRGSAQRIDFDKEIKNEMFRILVHSPKRITSITIGGIEYQIPDKWEGYVVSVELSSINNSVSLRGFNLLYCVVGEVCEPAEKIKNEPQAEYFFTITQGVKPIFIVYQSVGGGCSLFSCSQGYMDLKFYLCHSELDHLICEADELSFRPPNPVKYYDVIDDVKEGTKIYIDDVTIEVKSIKEVKFGSQKWVIDQENIRTYAIFSDLLYELELSLSGKIPMIKSQVGYFPRFRFYGCGILAGEMKCWWSFGELEINSGSSEDIELQDFRAKFFIPSASEINKIAIQKLYK
ncbi:MAG: hypothetical protein QXU40_04320 [Candidatus Pacearchaeota archaeon]